MLTPVLLLLPLLIGEPMKAPETPRKPTTEVYHGQPLVDPFQWLENADDEAVKTWVEKQNEFSRASIDVLPAYKPLMRRIRKAYEKYPPYFTEVQHANGTTVALREDNLVVLESEDRPRAKRTLVNVETIFPDHRAKVDFFNLSFDGKTVAVSLSVDGKEEGTLYLYDTATGKKLPDEISGFYTPVGGMMAWKHDNTGFYYTHHPNMLKDGPPTAGRYDGEEVWFHKVGNPIENDHYVFGKKVHRLARFTVEESRDGNWLLIGVSIGWGSDETRYYLRDATGKFRPLSDFQDQLYTLTFGPDKTLLGQLHKNAPRGKLIVMPLSIPDLKMARVIVPESDWVVHSWLNTDNMLYLLDRKDGSERMRIFDLPSGKPKGMIPIPPYTALDKLADFDNNVLVYKRDSFFEPAAWYRYDPSTHENKRLGISEKMNVPFEDAEIVREWATSRDGTRIPLTLIRKKDCPMDGNRPTMLTGYGGYNTHERPLFNYAYRVWLDHGGVWAIGHLRGDGDFGDEWHWGSRKATRQNTYDDFIACAEHLIAHRYTRPARLAITGGSNGGLLVGAALTQRPDLFAAVIGDCGIYDVIRHQKHASGFYDAAEDGFIDNPHEFLAIQATSPYHRVREEEAYPAVWLRVGGNDRRVSPAQSWKMAARLQATQSKHPVLLTTEPNEGHSFTTSLSEELAFYFKHLGVTYKDK